MLTFYLIGMIIMMVLLINLLIEHDGFNLKGIGNAFIVAVLWPVVLLMLLLRKE
jgi:hypothetical protein